MSTGTVAEELDLVRWTRRETLDLVAALSQDELERRPAPGKWSVGEVLDHLLLSDGIYRADIAELIARAHRGGPTELDRHFRDLDASILFIPKALLPLLELPLLLLNPLMPRSLRDFAVRSRWVPAQNPTATTPRPGRSGDELRRELAASLEELAGLIAANPDLDYRALVHRHPLLGTNDVPQLLRFVANHEARHQDQVRDTMRAVA